ncbi:MAG TPA: HD domain-containing protein [Clostridia bacterium]|nr:HD domain-containing protein [Clostridia bacterium]
MNQKQMIEEISNLVEETCKMDTNKFGYGIWSHHIVYVVQYAKQLAAMLGADCEVVEIAALLHDYAGIKDSSLAEKHQLHGATEAERILGKYDYSPEKIEQVKRCILFHRGSILSERRSPEGECVASADAMSHIDQVASLLYLAYTKHCMTIDEGKAWVLSKLERSWNKLCPEAREIIREDYLCAKKILE